MNRANTSEPRTHPSEIARFHGVHAATVCPFRADFSVDEDALAAHIAEVAAAPGLQGFLINGHAGENFLLTRAEKRRVVEIARAAMGEETTLVAGINAEASLEAAAEAAEAEVAGADGLLVFPPNGWALALHGDMALVHHSHVHAATRLPLMLYLAPVGSGRMPYGPDMLTALLDLPRVAGLKEGSWEVATYEANRRLVKRLRPEIAVLGSGDEHLLTSYIVGSEGSQVSLAAVVPDLVIALWEAASRAEWEAAREHHERLYPLAVAIYRAPPPGGATARLKTCLKILGRLADDRVRPPFQATPCEEWPLLEDALRHAGC